jgi:hypothetical protein
MGGAGPLRDLGRVLPRAWRRFIWNDSDYVTAPALRSLGGLARIWTEVGATQQYYPLLHSAFWVQHLLWGDRPLGYHMPSPSSCTPARRCCSRSCCGGCFAGPPRPPAGTEWLAALLFALHPVHVESVAWISEQKNTTSLAFYLASALLYLRFDETRRPGSYAAALALFACSLRARPSRPRSRRAAGGLLVEARAPRTGAATSPRCSLARARRGGGPVQRLGRAQVRRRAGRGSSTFPGRARPRRGPGRLVLCWQARLALRPQLRLSALDRGHGGLVAVALPARRPRGRRRALVLRGAAAARSRPSSSSRARFSPRSAS